MSTSLLYMGGVDKGCYALRDQPQKGKQNDRKHVTGKQIGKGLQATNP